VVGGFTDTQTTDDLISLLLFYQNKESRLKKELKKAKDVPFGETIPRKLLILLLYAWVRKKNSFCSVLKQLTEIMTMSS
jgi:hypothetical protein